MPQNVVDPPLVAAPRLKRPFDEETNFVLIGSPPASLEAQRTQRDWIFFFAIERMAKEKESAVKKITPQLHCGIAINRFADHPQTPDNFSRYIYKENYRKFKINVVLKDTSNVCKLDKLDCKMIRLLQKDGRMSNIEIAQQLGISEHTVRNRMK